MELWHTQLFCSGQHLGTIDIQCGIFQGDSFSPLLFVLDDLKLYGRNNREIHSLLSTVQLFSDDICMKFGLEKCASLSIKRGKVQTIVSPHIEGISPLSKGAVYKHLGVLESNAFDTAQMKMMVRQEFLKRSKTVLQTQLGIRLKDLICLQFHLFVTVLHYWTGHQVSLLSYVDVKFQKILSMNGAHHLKGDVDRLYLPRVMGGRGFLSMFDVGLERRFRSFVTFGGFMTFEEGFKHPNLRSHGYCCIPKPQSHLHFGTCKYYR